MNKRVLIIAAHADDEVLGCGGTIAKHTRQGDEVFLVVLTDGETSRSLPAQAERNKALEKSSLDLGIKKVKCLNLLDNQLDSYPLLEIVKKIEEEIKLHDPHIIYTHHGSDLNQDHRATYLATMAACRTMPERSLEQILTYEVPSSTEVAPHSFMPFVPNFYVALFSEDIEKKLSALKNYQAELRPFPHARSLEYITALHTIRGSTVGVAHAEAFVLERAINK